VERRRLDPIALRDVAKFRIEAEAIKVVDGGRREVDTRAELGDLSPLLKHNDPEPERS
jgi:hypothetical protein